MMSRGDEGSGNIWKHWSHMWRQMDAVNRFHCISSQKQSHGGVLKKFLERFVKFRGKCLYWNPLFSKSAGVHLQRYWKMTLLQMFPRKFCEICQNSCSIESLLVAASKLILPYSGNSLVTEVNSFSTNGSDVNCKLSKQVLERILSRFNYLVKS